MSAVLVLSDGLSDGGEVIEGCEVSMAELEHPGWLSTCVHVKRRGVLGQGAVICVLALGPADVRDRLGGKGMDSGPDRLGRDCVCISVLYPQCSTQGQSRNWKDE